MLFFPDFPDARPSRTEIGGKNTFGVQKRQVVEMGRNSKVRNQAVTAPFLVTSG